MKSLHELPTPAVLVDLDVLERNVHHMAERARAAGVRLRPHAKTHKTAEIARLQLAAGARGLSVAKTSEAEAFADAGFEDLFIAYPVVGLGKPERLRSLAARVRLRVGVDSLEGARALGAGGGDPLEVVLKVDVGFHRVGVPPEGAVAAARAIADLPGLRLAGVFTHAGHAYHAPARAEVDAVAEREGSLLRETAERLREAGLPCEEVSVGSTPTARRVLQVPGVTEARPGNYVFHDASQVSLGTCGLEDCALTVLATVVSTPAPARAVLDSGAKTLASDSLRPSGPGFGWLLGTQSRIARLSEEHGVVDVAPGDTFRVGDRVRVLPNHACVVANLHDRLLAIRGESVEGELPVLARGRVQ